MDRLSKRVRLLLVLVLLLAGAPIILPVTSPPVAQAQSGLTNWARADFGDEEFAVLECCNPGGSVHDGDTTTYTNVACCVSTYGKSYVSIRFGNHAGPGHKVTQLRLYQEPFNYGCGASMPSQLSVTVVGTDGNGARGLSLLWNVTAGWNTYDMPVEEQVNWGGIKLTREAGTCAYWQIHEVEINGPVDATPTPVVYPATQTAIAASTSTAQAAQTGTSVAATSVALSGETATAYVATATAAAAGTQTAVSGIATMTAAAVITYTGAGGQPCGFGDYPPCKVNVTNQTPIPVTIPGGITGTVSITGTVVVTGHVEVDNFPTPLPSATMYASNAVQTAQAATSGSGSSAPVAGGATSGGDLWAYGDYKFFESHEYDFGCPVSVGLFINTTICIKYLEIVSIDMLSFKFPAWLGLAFLAATVVAMVVKK